MDRLANLLGALGLALTDDLREVVASASGLPPVEAAGLNAVGQAPGCTVRHVSTVLAVTHGGAVRVVDRLAAAGLVERRPGRDPRAVALHLTAAGLARWERQGAARARLTALVEALDERVREPLVGATEVLLGALTASPDQAEHVCRLCDQAACPQDRCPVTLAAERQR
jgi:DNA-binding MarR family transcriptional regulator